MDSPDAVCVVVIDKGLKIAHILRPHSMLFPFTFVCGKLINHLFAVAKKNNSKLLAVKCLRVRISFRMKTPFDKFQAA